MKRSAPYAGPVNTRPRGWIAALPFILVTLILGACYAFVAGRLPERLATHFAVDGRPDGYSSPQDFLVDCLVGLLVLGVGLGLSVQRALPARAGRWTVATAYFTAVCLGGASVTILLGNARGGDPVELRLPAWQVAVMLGAGLVAGALGWLLAGAEPEAPRPQGGAVRRLDLPAGTRAGWSRTVSSPPMALLAAAMMCAGVLLGVFAGWVGGAVMLLGGLTVAVHCSVRVTVDRRGLSLTPTLLPVPLHRIPLAKVAEATSRRIGALAEYGGWGYRIQPGRSGLLLRSGEGMVLRLTSGREFVVTVDDSATAAALLNTYLDRHRSGEGS
ncbi:Protein of unknown function (DUF1648) [Streptomyces noursei ATCC 11455]|uniref:DUF1648 domain-containing protein n=1 Tax=Streptomyces noursei TaxID=1971 RepID=UPI00081C412B|nr:Protein of unknown function (DUF1648) [Streptomyces noursei ATCC 11455]